VKERADTARRAVASTHAHNPCAGIAIANSTSQQVLRALDEMGEFPGRRGNGWCSSQLPAEAERVMLMPPFHVDSVLLVAHQVAEMGEFPGRRGNVCSAREHVCHRGMAGVTPSFQQKPNEHAC
jgi:hypothetical protein